MEKIKLIITTTLFLIALSGCNTNSNTNKMLSVQDSVQMLETLIGKENIVKQAKIQCKNCGSLTKNDSIQILKQLFNNKEFISGFSSWDKTIPVVFPKNGFIRNTYNLNSDGHKVVFATLQTLLYEKWKEKYKFKNPELNTTVERTGAKIMLDVTRFDFNPKSGYIGIVNCHKNTFLSYTLTLNNENKWEIKLKNSFQFKPKFTYTTK